MKTSKIPQFVTFPLLMTVAVIVVYAFSNILQINITDLGIYPRTINGLKGILFAPFVHGNLQHLLSNISALPALLCILVLTNKQQYHKIFAFLYALTGLLVWIIARNSYHIGISGIIYSLASYIFFSGIVSANKGASALSLLIIILYGSMIWGILPQDNNISWESHLCGGVAGFISAFIFVEHHNKANNSINLQAPQFSKNIGITHNQYKNITYIYINKEYNTKQGL